LKTCSKLFWVSLAALFPGAQPVLAAPPSHRSLTAHFAAWIRTVRPKASPAYANRLARAFVREGHRYHIDPYRLAACAVAESEFNMNARGGTGVMQITSALYRETKSWHGYDRHNIDDNVRMGAEYLAGMSHLKKVSRHRSYQNQVKEAYAVYNGSAIGGSYTRHCATVQARLYDSPETWRTHLASRSLWQKRGSR
jgi:soluble lytic murein transglycosylase-like protein